MAEQFETPAEREAKFSVQNARLNEAIAEDVAVTMAAEADQERARANAIARGNINLQREAETARFNSLYASNEAVAAKQDANKSKFNFWLLASVLAATLLFGSIWAANRKDDTATASSASQPQVVTRTITVSPSPAVIREYVPVPVPVQPVPVVQPVPAYEEPAPVRGYVQPTPRPAPSLAAPAPAPSLAPVVPATSPDQPLGGFIER